MANNNFSREFERLKQTATGTLSRLNDELKVIQDKFQADEPNDNLPYSYKNSLTKKEKKALFIKPTGALATGWMMASVGYTLSAGTAIAYAGITGFANFISPGSTSFLPNLIIFGIPFVATLFLGIKGTIMISRASRFKSYLHALRGKAYVRIDALATAVRKSTSFVRRDVERMITKHWFKEGHVNVGLEDTYLLVSDRAYQSYREEQTFLLDEKTKHEQIQLVYAALPDNARDVVEEGKAYVQRMQEKRLRIADESVVSKVLGIEQITEKIFQHVKEHPEVVPNIRKLMEYYLPTTMKLLDSYERLDLQPVKGDNISKAKYEIEGALDTLITAYEKLLDGLFKDVAWDVATDISVLNTILTQEGLTKNNDFTNRKTKDDQNE